MTVENISAFEHMIGARGRFHVRLMSGSIAIRAVDGETVRVRERSGKSIQDAFRVEAGEGTLSLSAPDRGGIELVVFGIGRRSSLDLEVEVPRGARISVELASADVDGTGLAGRTRVRTASGDIELRDVSGDLEIDAVSGEVTVDGLETLALRCRTISGDFALRAPRISRATVETTSGDVRLDALLEGSGPFEVRTVSGDATIVGRMGVRVDARTVTGDIRSDLPHRMDSGAGHKRMTVGDGGTTLEFKSVSGDLRIVAPRDRSGEASGSRAAEPLPPATPAAPALPVKPQQPEVPAMPDQDPRDEAPDVEPITGLEAGREVARLDILQALERGEMSVEAAMERLADIEEA